MKIRKWMIAGVVIAALAAVVLPRVLAPKETESAAAVPNVVLGKPETGTIAVKTGLTGKVEPSDMVYVIPKAAGEVTEVLVSVGDTVEEGQNLLHIDTKQVDGAKIQLDTATVNLSDANTNLKRMQVLAQSGDISQQQLEAAQSAAKMAKLQYDGAKLAYDNQLEFSDVTAPIGGRIESLSVEVHDNVAAGTVLCVISGEGTKAVSFNVTERIVSNLSVGDSVEVEKNGTVYHGLITDVDSMVDAASGLFKVKASMEKADALPTGTIVKLYVVSEQSENTMLIPADAVHYSGGNAYVYTEAEGMVHEVPVTVGVYDAEKAEILEGITPDDEIIVTWSAELYEGAAVQPVGQEAAPAESEAAPDGKQ